MPAILLSMLAGGQVAISQQISGELKQWHDVVLTFDGPSTSESAEPNPFLFYRLDVTFTKGAKKYVVPGYFAADGNAANTSAKTGNKWRVHFIPDEVGEWSYSTSFRSGPEVAVSMDPNAGKPLAPDGAKGTLKVGASDKSGRDHRAHGMLAYVGEHYAQYRGPANTSSRPERRVLRTFSRITSLTTLSTTAVRKIG